MAKRTHARESRTTLPVVLLSVVQNIHQAPDLSRIASTRIRGLPSSDLYTPQSAEIAQPAELYLLHAQLSFSHAESDGDLRYMNM